MSDELTQEDLRDYILNTWLAQDGHGMSPSPTPGQSSLIQAMLTAIAAGILLVSGGSSSVVQSVLKRETLVGSGISFRLAFVPLSDVLVILNGWVVEDYTLNGQDLTLPQAKAEADSLTVYYQYIGG